MCSNVSLLVPETHSFTSPLEPPTPKSGLAMLVDGVSLTARGTEYKHLVLIRAQHALFALTELNSERPSAGRRAGTRTHRASAPPAHEHVASKKSVLKFRGVPFSMTASSAELVRWISSTLEHDSPVCRMILPI